MEASLKQAAARMRLLPAQEQGIAPADYRRLQYLYGEALAELNLRISNLQREQRLQLGRAPIHHVQTRIKTYSSICEKLTRKGYAVSIECARDRLCDIAGMRIVCPTVEDAYDVGQALRALPGIGILRERDYIRAPKENGYRSLHVVLSVPVCTVEGARRVPVEVQVRTLAMDVWASLEHDLCYKREATCAPRTRREMQGLSRRMAEVDARLSALRRETELS